MLHWLLRAAAAAASLLLTTQGGAALPPEPAGPHPRLFAEPGTLDALQQAARRRGSVVARAVTNCGRIADAPAEFARDGYMGLDWARSLQTCLVAWRATGEDRHAQTALVYFKALLDDRTTIGDGAGGDASARRDSGYAIRALGPYTALAYDWLHDHPAVDEALRARARQRFVAWTRWYEREGYRAHHPGNNYHAGYVAAATLMAVAMGGEGGEDSARLWRSVVERTFGAELLPAARDGVLTGGDWGEGWQYGPLSIANYALAARAVAPYGVDVAPLGQWLEDVFLRHAYAMTPSGQRTLVVGDTQSEQPHIAVRRDTLEPVVFGPAPERAREWARAELARLDDDEREQLGFLLFGALADATPGRAVDFPREGLGRAFFARGTSILYARSRWDEHAVWFAAFCSSTIDVDHLPPHAGNFVLSRGRDHAIVDPTPYGSLSSLTSNAPTVEATGQPPGYVPSQTFWSRATRFVWKQGFGEGGVLARCDYADQYRFRDEPSPIPLAWRDFVLLPWRDAEGRDAATLVIADRARTREAAHALHLRFRSKESFEGTGEAASVALRDSRLDARRLSASGGTPELRALARGDCFSDRYTRGNCDASRFAASEVRLVVPGPAPRALFALDLGPRGDAPPPATALAAEGGEAWLFERGGERFVVALADGDAPLAYTAPAGVRHVVLPGRVGGQPQVAITLVADGGTCRVRVGEGPTFEGPVALLATDAACAATTTPRREVAVDFAGLQRTAP
jgi:hypothetical protein